MKFTAILLPLVLLAHQFSAVFDYAQAPSVEGGGHVLSTNHFASISINGTLQQRHCRNVSPVYSNSNHLSGERA